METLALGSVVLSTIVFFFGCINIIAGWHMDNDGPAYFAGILFLASIFLVLFGYVIKVWS